MNISYKRLTEKELDTFIRKRINQLREEGATEDIDLVPALRDYYNRHIADGNFCILACYGRREDYRHQRYVLCREAAVLWMPKWKDWSAFEYVYGSELSPYGDCEGASVKSC